MRWFQRNKIDEHDMPTEPLPHIDDPTQPAPSPGGAHDALTELYPGPHMAAGWSQLPPAQPYEQTAPYRPAGSIQSSPQQQQQQVYPYLPARPQQIEQPRHWWPAGWFIPFPVRQQPVVGSGQSGGGGSDSGSARRTRHTGLPTLVGLFFIAIQILLLLRFVINIVNLGQGNSWTGLIEGISQFFVWPFAAFWQQVPLQLPVNIEIYTLLAVLVYGLLSRILVRTLKIVLR